MTVDHVRAGTHDHHQPQGPFLQKDIHGKIVIMPLSLYLPGLTGLFLSRVGIDILFFPKSFTIKEVNFHPFLLSTPDPHPFTPFLFGVIQVHFKLQAPLRVQGISKE